MSDVSNPIFHGRLRFPATQVPSADANTLDDYEEGEWTPIDSSGAGLTLVGATGVYNKFGRTVVAHAALTYPATADTSAGVIGGLPFTTANAQAARQGFVSGTDESTLAYALPAANATTVALLSSSLAAVTNATMSGNVVYFTAIYYIAT